MRGREKEGGRERREEGGEAEKAAFLAAEAERLRKAKEDEREREERFKKGERGRG